MLLPVPGSSPVLMTLDCFIIQHLFQEWSKDETELPSPLKNDAPTWARSPKIPIDTNTNQHESLNRFKTSCSPSSIMEHEKWTKAVSSIISSCHIFFLHSLVIH